MEVLAYWTNEIAIKPTKTALFKQLTSLMTYLIAYAGEVQAVK
jgi:hypothetical protein